MTTSSTSTDVDLNLTPQQMLMFIHGLKYIISCQSRFSCRSTDQFVTQQYQDIVATVKNCPQDHRLSPKDERAKDALAALPRLLYELHSKLVPKNLLGQAKHEHKIVPHLLRQRPEIGIRRTAHCRVFYIGKSHDFVQSTAV